MALAGLCRALPRLSVQPIRSVAGCSALASWMRETGTVHNMSVEVKGRAASRARASAQAVHTSCWSASSISVTVPPLGESISDGTIASVLKQVGDSVAEDEAIVQIETDKVTVDVRAPQAGVIEKLLVSTDENVVVGTVVALISSSASEGARSTKAEAPVAAPAETSVPATIGATAAMGRSHRPSIHFPPRRLPDGRAISDLSAAESSKTLVGLVEPIDRKYPPTVEAAAANPTPKEGVFLQHRRDVTEVPLGGSILERTPMSEAEAEAIMLGGAEP